MLREIARQARQPRCVIFVIFRCLKACLPHDILQRIEKPAVVAKGNARFIKRREALTLCQDKAQQIIIQPFLFREIFRSQCSMARGKSVQPCLSLGLAVRRDIWQQTLRLAVTFQASTKDVAGQFIRFEISDQHAERILLFAGKGAVQFNHRTTWA